jgi:hypothetical protein
VLHTYVIYLRSGMPGVVAAVIGWARAAGTQEVKAQAALDHGIPEKDLLVLPKNRATSAEWKEALRLQTETDNEQEIEISGT